MDTSILDNLGNLGNLESLGSPDPGLITGLVLVASVLGLVLAIALIVFCIVKAMNRATSKLKKEEAVQEAAAGTGVRAVIFKSPCIAVTKPQNTYTVNQDACRKCKVCVRELGCPAIVTEGDTVKIDETLCYGCGVCSYVCPFQAIGEVKENE